VQVLVMYVFSLTKARANEEEQNLMAHTSNNASSFWFLTSTSDSYKASMYWRELGQELDHESHVATMDELAKASFPIYVCKQELGGFVIVPPRSCHQVLNSGGFTTVIILELCFPYILTRPSRRYPGPG
jgi:hypothetical protein